MIPSTSRDPRDHDEAPDPTECERCGERTSPMCHTADAHIGTEFWCGYCIDEHTVYCEMCSARVPTDSCDESIRADENCDVCAGCVGKWNAIETEIAS